MRIYTRHFFEIFLKYFAWVFILTQLFAVLCALLGFLPDYPQVPIIQVIIYLPDLALALLPISLPFSIAVAAGLFMAELHDNQGFLWINIAGRTSYRFLSGVLSFGLAVSAALYYFNSCVLPKMLYHSKYLVTAPGNSVVSLANQLTVMPNYLKGFSVDFTLDQNKRFKDFSMVAPKGELLVANAKQADIKFVDDNSLVLIELEKGRFLKFNSQRQLEINLLFKRFSIWLDTARLVGPDKNEIIGLEYYTNRELNLLPELKRFRENHGLKLDNSKKKRVVSIAQAKAVRLQSGVSPFLILLVITLFLAEYKNVFPFQKITLTCALCMAVYFSQQIFFEQKAWRGELPYLATAFLPSIEAGAAVLLWAFYKIIGGSKQK